MLSVLFGFIHIVRIGVLAQCRWHEHTVDLVLFFFLLRFVYMSHKCLIQKGLDVFLCDLTNTITCTMLDSFFSFFYWSLFFWVYIWNKHNNRKIQAYFVQIIIKFAFFVYYAFFSPFYDLRILFFFIIRVEDLSHSECMFAFQTK